MQFFVIALGLLMRPAGCLALILFVAAEILIGIWFGSTASWLAAVCILASAFLSMGRSRGGVALMRALQVMLGVSAAAIGLMAFVLLLGGFTQMRGWFAAAVAVGLFFAARSLGRRIARAEEGPDARAG